MVGRSLWVVTVVAGWCLLALANTAHAQRAIPDDNLAYPVLVQLPDGTPSGSGFYLRTATSVYLVTAKHVLFNPQSGLLPQVSLLSYSRDPKQSARNIISVDLVALSKAGDVNAHSREDVAVVRIAKFAEGAPPAEDSSARKIESLSGIVFRETAPNGILGVAVKSLKKYDEVLVANEVFVFGYPTSLGLKLIPQLDPLRPLLRKGIVAGQNPATKSLVIDCPAYPGNSGGPVLEVVREGLGGGTFRVIGVVREFVPYEEKWLNLRHGYSNSSISNSGYAIATPMDFVLELVK